MSDHDNYYKRTVVDFMRDVERDGLVRNDARSADVGRDAHDSADLSDVNANTVPYLMNGTTASGNWTGLFRAGEKVRLRFINGLR
jgi:FtsP/CotA-like multicopper oxidase with cupredoxin domain